MDILSINYITNYQSVIMMDICEHLRVRVVSDYANTVTS